MIGVSGKGDADWLSANFIFDAVELQGAASAKSAASNVLADRETLIEVGTPTRDDAPAEPVASDPHVARAGAAFRA